MGSGTQLSSPHPLLSSPGLFSSSPTPDRALGLTCILCWWAQTLLTSLCTAPKPLSSPRSSAGTILPPRLFGTSHKPRKRQHGTSRHKSSILPPNPCDSVNNKLWLPVPPKLLFMTSKMKQHGHTCCKPSFRVQDSILFVHLFGDF